MSFDRLPISVGKTAPSHETHYVGAVEQQHRRAVAIKPMPDRIERSFVNFLHRGDVLESFRKLVQCGLLMHPPCERLLCYFSSAYVVLNAHGVKEPARAVPDARRSDVSPEVCAVFATNPLFDGVSVNFACKLTPEFLEIARSILWQRLLEHGPAQQLGRRMAGQLR